MFWKNIILKNYLPFTHTGIKTVDISVESPVTAYLGGNGSGKSSLLRAMSVYPATRTDFGKDGKIVKVLEHNGHLFELTSDFSNPTSPHSFKKDDVQLNLSGTTETQIDLCNEHFGVTKLIEDICAGNIKLCSLRKAERKALFSATYPSDLSFVIEYHKKVCSQIRACGNQLKLLKGREATLRGSLIDETERQKLERFRVAATELIDKIDKAQLLLEAENTRLKQAPSPKEQCHYSYDGWEMLDVRDEILCLGQDVIRGFRQTGIRNRLRDSFNADSIEAMSIRHKEQARNAEDQIKGISLKVEEIRDELNRFTQAKEISESITEKSTLESRFAVCQRELADVDQQLGTGIAPCVDLDKIDRIETEVCPKLKSWIDGFYPNTSKIKSDQEVHDLGIKIEHMYLSIGTELRNELATVTERIQGTTDKLTKLESRPYPKDCVQVCPLRESVADSISNTKKILDDLIHRRDTLLKQQKEAMEFLQAHEPEYKAQLEYHNQITTLCQYLNEFNLCSIAFEHEDDITCCRDHIYEIHNRVVQACARTRLTVKKQELQNEMESIRHTLATLAATKQIQMSMDLITNTIRDREEKMSLCCQDLDALESFIDKENDLASRIMKISEAYRSLDYRVTDAYLLLNQERIDMKIEFNNGLIKELGTAKSDLQEELYKVSKTLQDQQKNIDILESEILPTAATVQHDKEIYEAVADGLSPTSGLPCIYLIRFINRLLTRANKIISDVWYYDMELKYLKEEDDLDFSIGCIFRNSTEVKDISECSLGQQAIIDLALTLALCIERGFLEWQALRLDEVDGALTEDHRTRLVSLINKLIEDGTIKQLFLVNHFAIQTGVNKCDSVVLSAEGILVPQTYNEHAVIS